MKKPKNLFRKTGQITYEGDPIEVWLSRNGEMQFKKDGKDITKEEQEKILAYLKSANE